MIYYKIDHPSFKHATAHLRVAKDSSMVVVAAAAAAAAAVAAAAAGCRMMMMMMMMTMTMTDDDDDDDEDDDDDDDDDDDHDDDDDDDDQEIHPNPVKVFPCFSTLPIFQPKHLPSHPWASPQESRSLLLSPAAFSRAYRSKALPQKFR